MTQYKSLELVESGIDQSREFSNVFTLFNNVWLTRGSKDSDWWLMSWKRFKVNTN